MVQELDRRNEQIDERDLPTGGVWSMETSMLVNSILGEGTNSPPKSGILLVLSKLEGIASSEEISAELQRLTGQTEIDISSPRAVSSYIEHCLEPAGLVVRSSSEGITDNVIGYSLSDLGLKYGLPAAALEVLFHKKYPEISLFNIFGSTATTSDRSLRSPTIRALLLDILTQQEKPMSTSELYACLAEDVQYSLITRNIDWLVRKEILTIDKSGAVIGYSKGTTSIDGISSSIADSMDLPAVWATCESLWKQKKEVTPASILHSMGITESAEIYPRLHADIAVLFESLVQEHVLDEVRDGAIQVTEAGKTITAEFLKPLLTMITGQVSEYTQGIWIRQAMSDEKTYASFLLSYIPFSKGAMRLEYAGNSLDTRIYYAVSEFGENGLTARQLIEMFDLKIATTSHALSRLVKSGKLVQKRVDGTHDVKYYPSQEQDAATPA